MCGIAGRFNFDAAHPVDRARLVAMTDAVAHRGPDAGGYYLDGGIGLGHRRLSIIDLATGDQPIGNEDGSIQVIFNGEIYNFAEVRRELLAHGHRFRTNSDTEVIVHGYEQWGEHCVDRFRGMFAFAVWDARTRAAAARPRPARRQAALLRRGARRAGVRLGDQVAARGPAGAARMARRCARRLPDAALHPGARHDLPRHPQAAAGARARSPSAARCASRGTGTSSSPANATGGAKRSTSKSSTPTCAKPCSSA